ARLSAVVDAVPGRWGPALRQAVLRRVADEADATPLLVAVGGAMATHLDPVVRPALDRWAEGAGPAVRERVARIGQYLTLVTEIPEAFQ
ncbi:hypothetical protein, partial [Angustibacter aerolatus]